MADFDIDVRKFSLRSWPSPQDYNEAVQDLRTNTTDAQLQSGQVELTPLGLPRPLSGAFASVYRVACLGCYVALRCFLREISDQHERYRLISSFVQNDTLPYTVAFEFIEGGIRVNGSWRPVLKMDWVDGLTLDLFIERNLGMSAIQNLADRFKTMCQDLESAGIAHGDLQHGNIIVCGDELRLVDYDGMFVPAMSGMKSTELGHRNYQHPARSAEDFGPHLDRFSAWVIYASLRILAIDPALYRQLAAGDDCLLFRRDDFLEPEHSYAFALLEHHPHPDVQGLAKCIRWQCGLPVKDISPLSETLPNVDRLAPLPMIPPGRRNHPRMAAVTEPTAGGALPDWIDPQGMAAAALSARNGLKNPPARYSLFGSGGATTYVHNNRLDYLSQHSQPNAQVQPHTFEPELCSPAPRYVEMALNSVAPSVAQRGLLQNPVVWCCLLAVSTIPQWWGFSVVLVAVAAVAYAIWWNALLDKWLVQNGACAFTVGTWRVYSWESSISAAQVYCVEYEFCPANGPLTGGNVHASKRISKDRYQQLMAVNPSSTLTVLYDRDQPEFRNGLYCLMSYKAAPIMVSGVEPELLQPIPRTVHCIKGASWHWFGSVSIALFAALLLIANFFVMAVVAGAGLYYLLWRRRYRQRSLVSWGVPVKATIKDLYTMAHGMTRIVYEFRTRQGLCTGDRELDLAELDAMGPPTVGQQITVLYDSENPSDSMIYALSDYGAG